MQSMEYLSIAFPYEAFLKMVSSHLEIWMKEYEYQASSFSKIAAFASN